MTAEKGSCIIILIILVTPIIVIITILFFNDFRVHKSFVLIFITSFS